MPEAERYGIAELAELGGVSRRTVRYYVREGLLPAPLGVGRGRHYGRAHLDRLLRVRALQEQGWSLEAIRASFDAGAQAPAAARAGHPPAAPARSTWTRIEIAPGIELEVSSTWRLPSPAGLAALGELCRRIFRRKEDSDV